MYVCVCVLAYQNEWISSSVPMGIGTIGYRAITSFTSQRTVRLFVFEKFSKKKKLF